MEENKHEEKHLEGKCGRKKCPNKEAEYVERRLKERLKTNIIWK